MPDEPLDLEPDAPPPPRAERADRRKEDDPLFEQYDPDDDHREDDRDRDYHPRGPHAKYDEDGFEITQEHIMWAIFAHLGVMFLDILAPIIILLAVGGKSPFIARHSKESINHRITLYLVMVLVILLGVVIGYGTYLATQDGMIGFWVGYAIALLGLLPLGIVNLVTMILATVAAAKGRPYRYPMTVRLIG